MSVSSLNIKIKSLLEATFMHTMVEGEVASATYHSSGHLYFSIKDNQSTIKCVMWRSSVARMKFRIAKGMQIVVDGSISVYTPRGEYQFQTVRIEPYGQGALALAYEQLKEKLKNKGYFDAQRKKPIPKHIHKIALVTAKNSAGLHDMLKIIEKRWALVEVFIVDTLVQGERGATSIANALAYADTLDADVVVVGRGGGSAEDLWCFNEEKVADAIFAMQTAVVSAVGHEVDVMISDFVADLRAPTPSASIEMILPDANEVLYTLSQNQEHFSRLMTQKIAGFSRELSYQRSLFAPVSPRRKIALSEEKALQLKGLFLSNMKMVLAKKQDEITLMQKTFEHNNPKIACQKGWSQTSINGKRVALSTIESKQKFTLEDEFTKIEALCISVD
jgi:exodeoxyribonuclease VII large subunit